MKFNYEDLKSNNWLSVGSQSSWFDQLKQAEKGINSTAFKYFIHNLLPPSAKENQKFNQDQVERLFELFDSNHDQWIDRKEFSTLCNNWLHRIFNVKRAFIAVDVQNDFIGGSLALINGPAHQDGKEVVPIINDILKRVKFDLVVYTHDWHPVDHIGFYENLHMRDFSKIKPSNSSSSSRKVSSSSRELTSDDLDLRQQQQQPQTNNTDEASNDWNNSNNREREEDKSKKSNVYEGVSVFDTVYFNNGNVEQILWPRHCVQNSWGSQLDKDLLKVENSINIYKGTLPDVDAYSIFWDNQRMNETELARELKSRQITDVFICGLAIDYCVSASAIDAVQYGFLTFVIEDACRGIDQVSIKRRCTDMVKAGCLMTNAREVIDNKFETASSLFRRAMINSIPS